MTSNLLPQLALWRNGSASDSRSDGWAFESLWRHLVLIGRKFGFGARAGHSGFAGKALCPSG